MHPAIIKEDVPFDKFGTYIMREISVNAIVDLFARITEALDQLFRNFRGCLDYKKVFIMLPPCGRMFVDRFIHTNYCFFNSPYIQNEIELDGCKDKIKGYVIRGCNLIFISPTEDAYVFIDNWDRHEDYNRYRFTIPIVYSNE